MLAKYCPRCNKPFECQLANIAECQCAKVKVSPSLKKWLATHLTIACVVIALFN